MGSTYGSQIVTSGLTLLLDASNVNSYRGAGSVWVDQSQGLLFNSTGATQTPYTRVNGVRCFDFNGSGYWQCSSGFGQVDMGGDCTLIIWLYHENPPTRRTIFEKAGTVYASYQQEIAVTWEVNTVPHWSWYSRYSPDYDYAGFADGTANAWNMLAIKMSTGKTSAARTGFYSVNGGAWGSAYTSRSNTALVAAGAITVGAGYAGVVEVGYINSVYCYNKMLTDAEIAQNYNALRKKFGK